jgi:hypothetical protein
MGANTVTSSSGTSVATSTDVGFTVTHTGRNYKNGIYLYISYTVHAGGTVTLTFDVLNPNISSTVYYRMEEVKDADGTVSAVTFSLAAADGNYRLFVPMHANETLLRVNATLQTTGHDSILDVEFMED